MSGPAPKPASQRQRRNRTTTAATLEAAPAVKVDLPAYRVSMISCASCSWVAWHHTPHWFRKAELAEVLDVEPHDYDPKPIEWRAGTRQWWDTIWASPMVEEWVDADVPGLLALAVLVDEFWTTGDPKVHAEVRQASRDFGLSPLSRRQLQWEIKRLAATPQPAPAKRPARRRGGAVLSVLQGQAG